MPDFTPRPTVYKGIQMRSRLEAGFAQWLDEWQIPGWKYEPGAFASAEGQYLPDFWVPELTLTIEDFHTAPAYIEVKPHVDFESAPDIARRMGIIWESEPDAHLVVAYPSQNNTDDASWCSIVATSRADGGELMLYGCHWLFRQKGRPLAIGLALPQLMGPWYGEWWKGKNA